MFTGIIEEIGTIKNIVNRGRGLQLDISAKKILSDLAIDHSVAVNGVCLTVVEINQDFFAVDAVAETLARSTLSQIKRTDAVNLERALRLQDRLGGHLVQGHVDGIGTIRDIHRQINGSAWIIDIPEELERYTIPKGSIAIDGISLTIAEKNKNRLRFAIIPHTIQHTILQFKKAGSSINIEVDFMAKYVEQFLNKKSETTITSDWLKEKGFF